MSEVSFTMLLTLLMKHIILRISGEKILLINLTTYGIKMDYIYIAESVHPSLEDLVKIGTTTREPQVRLLEAKSDPTFLCQPVKVRAVFKVHYALPFEQYLHGRLNLKKTDRIKSFLKKVSEQRVGRVVRVKEWHHLTVETAIKIVSKYSGVLETYVVPGLGCSPENLVLPACFKRPPQAPAAQPRTASEVEDRWRPKKRKRKGL